jgi:acetyl-CoA carboxylase carboxyltransferase component
MIGSKVERDGIIRAGAKMISAVSEATVPTISVIVRKCYGVAGGGMIDRAGLNFKIAWPSGNWGSLPVEGGVKAAYKRDIESAPDPEQREREIEEELRRLASPFRTAEAFAIEDLIDPRETRPYLCQFIEALQPRLRTQLGPKARMGVRP